MAMATMTINVNGTNRTITCDDTTPLLWVVRDILGLTGPKYGCGVEICKACSMWLDESSEKTCLLQVKEVLAKRIVTIEGLMGTDPNGDPALPSKYPNAAKLMQAWIDEQVPQCGFCQSGMLMFATQMTRGTAKPTPAQIDSAISNICACGTYPRVKRGILRASGQNPDLV